MEKNEKKIGLLVFPNIFTEQWGSCLVFKIIDVRNYAFTLITEIFFAYYLLVSSGMSILANVL